MRRQSTSRTKPWTRSSTTAPRRATSCCSPLASSIPGLSTNSPSVRTPTGVNLLTAGTSSVYTPRRCSHVTPRGPSSSSLSTAAPTLRPPRLYPPRWPRRIAACRLRGSAAAPRLALSARTGQAVPEHMAAARAHGRAVSPALRGPAATPAPLPASRSRRAATARVHPGLGEVVHEQHRADGVRDGRQPAARAASAPRAVRGAAGRRCCAEEPQAAASCAYETVPSSGIRPTAAIRSPSDRTKLWPRPWRRW